MCEFFCVDAIYIVYLRVISGSGCVSWFDAVSRNFFFKLEECINFHTCTSHGWQIFHYLRR